MNSYYEKLLATGEVKCIDDEIPFEIPQGWAWCRLQSVCEYIQRGKSPKYSPIKKYPVVAQKCNQWSGFSIEKALFIAPDSLFSYKEERILKDGDLMWNSTGLGTLGRMAIYYSHVNPYELAVADSHVTVIRLCKQYVFPEFLYLYFASPTVQLVIEDKADGSTKQKELATTTIMNYIVPLPPLAEQKRIINQYSAVNPKVSLYSVQQEKLDELNLALKDKFKKSILQESIQGKLVPQNLNDEAASVLLQRIHDEKLRLVKEGKLKKKDVTDSVIFRGDDNKYYERIDKEVVEIEVSYDFPDNWCVLRLKDVCQLIDGEKRTGKGICLDAKYLRGKSSPTYLDSGKFVQTNDNIILVDGENSGEVFTVPHEGYMGSTFKQLWVSENMYLPYVLYFIQFYKDLLRNSKKGAAIPHLNKDIFYSLVIGIPPYQEQKRMAERFQEIIDKIKA